MLSHIVDKIRRSRSIEDILAAAKAAEGSVRVSGLLGSSGSIFTSILHGELGPTTAVICPNGAENIKEDLESILGDEAVLSFPDWEILPYDEFSPHEAIVGTRLRTLSRLLAGEGGVVVIPLRALMRRIIPPHDLAKAVVEINLGRVISPEQLVSSLVRMGYTRRQVVEDVGTFATRGGIIDVYPQGLDNPVRVEFFGNDIDSIREFDPITQRSIKRIEKSNILPAREIVLSEEAIERFMGRLRGKRLKG